MQGNHITLTWNASAGAVSYNVYRSLNGGAITQLKKGVTTTSYKDFAVTPGTTYSYQVTAVGSSGAESARSAIYSVHYP